MKNKYFPTKSDCICKMNSLNPDKIKQYFKQELNKSNIKPKQFYTEVAKLLGFNAWDEYQSSYKNKILPFMKQYGLNKFAPNHNDKLNINILKSEHDISFNYRELSDRLFLSGKLCPKSIFTGYGCKTDFIHHYYTKQYFNKETMNLELADISKEDYQQLLSENKFDLLIPVNVGNFCTFKNLLGDAFLKYNDTYNYEYIFEEYMDNKGLHKHESQKNNAIKFHNTILELNKGWIEIIPFNNNLIFLKSIDGYYDFVFKNLRDDKFISPYYDFIKHENIPTLLNEDYDFERWSYYGFKDTVKIKKNIKPLLLWKEMDNHNAEINFYESHTRDNYTSPSKILKNYYIKEGKYNYDRKITSETIPGFNQFQLKNHKVLCLSNLITIGEFNKFYNDTYKDTRSKRLDEITTINDDDKSSPVSVTWYDAIAYCRYIETKYNIPTRLITSLEYKEISPKIEKALGEKDFKTYDEYFNYTQSKDYRLNHNPYATNTNEELIFSYDNVDFNGIPSYMNDFENVIMKYKKQMVFTEINNIKFSNSSSFVEWTNDFRSDYVKVTSIKFANSLQESKLLASSNNKYKYLKVGFRVCYELDNSHDK